MSSLSTKELVSTIIFGIIVIIGIGLGIKQKIDAKDPLNATPELEEFVQTPSTEKSKPTIEAKTSDEKITTPSLVYIEQQQDTSTEPPLSTITLLTWDPLSKDGPIERTTIEGAITQTALHDNGTILIDYQEKLGANRHEIRTVTGATSKAPIPSTGNLVTSVFSPDNTASAHLKASIIEEADIELYINDEKTTITPNYLTKSNDSTNDKSSENKKGDDSATLAPLGFSKDSKSLYILKESTLKNKTTRTILAYNIKKKTTEKIIETASRLTLVAQTASSLIFEKHSAKGTAVTAINPTTKEETLLIGRTDYDSTIIEHKNHISPNQEQIILTNTKKDGYLLFNTATEEATPWKPEGKIIGFLNNETIIATNGQQLQTYNMKQEEQTKQDLPKKPSETTRIILGITQP